jgi:glycosyltransferase involved in cell wall biosynthesis
LHAIVRAFVVPVYAPAVRVLVVTNVYPSPDRPFSGTFVHDQVESLHALGLELDVLHVRRHAAGAGIYRGLGGRVRDQARDTGADVVHVMYGGVMAESVTRAVDEIPVVVSFCGTDLLGGRAGSLVTRVRERVGVLASRRAARRADAVIVKSSALRAALPAGLADDRVWLIPNGVDTDRFAPAPREAARSALDWPPDERIVLFPAAPNRPEKRFELARDAVAELERTTPGVRLHMLEGVAHRDVPTWLNAVDAVVLTSLHEGSPNVVKEALACCTPVVSVDVGDVRERIDGVPGCAVAAADPVSLASALGAALRAERDCAGRARIEELSHPRVAAQIAGIYAGIVSSAR